MKAAAIIALITTLIVGVGVYISFTIWVIPPMGAVPEGGTYLISRLNKTQFIDSADAVCEREQGGVNLLCRGAVLAAVAENSDIHFRFPYSNSMYLISTGGKTYER
jgi:hypothetical protein